MSIPVLILVGADKGGVGKTMITRALLDYFKDRGVQPSVFDTEPVPGVLHRFFPYAKTVDVTQVSGQMRVFDEVPASGVTVVDVRAGGLSWVLGVMKNAGLLKDVFAGQMRMVVIHVLGSTEASLREIAAVAEVLKQGGEHILVKNHATDGQFFEWDKATHTSYFGNGNILLVIPHLDGLICDAVEQRGISFTKFLADPKNSRLQRGLLQHWLDQVWKEFDRLGIAKSAALAKLL